MVERSPLPEGSFRIPVEQAHDLVVSSMTALGVAEGDARITADVLTSADLRGIRSHGIARLPYFLSRLSSGAINTGPEMTLERGSATTALLDADRGLGTAAAHLAMESAMAMAEVHGTGFVSVRRSSHFGYAGYWADLARRSGFIGIAMSNGGGHVAPTFAIEGVLGTNPLSVTIPGGEDVTDFYLDMATSTVALGKIETSLREGRELPDGWLPEGADPPALDERGKLLVGTPVLPLGGSGEESGGHKGYGLSLLVELLSGALSGSPLPGRLTGVGEFRAPSVGHFIGAIRLSGFRDPAEIRTDIARTFETIRGARRDPAHERIYIHGEPEAEAALENAGLGVAVTPTLRAQLLDWTHRAGLRLGWLETEG